MSATVSTYLKGTAAWAPVVIRVVLGIIFMAHGSQKLFGAFGGPGISGTSHFLHGMGIEPSILWAWIVALAEFLGGLGLVLGFLTGLSSAVIIVDMLVAIATVHGTHGFWAGGGGFEYNLLIVAVCVSLIISGPGAISVDRLIGWKF
jgi:putative oxidoreductase